MRAGATESEGSEEKGPPRPERELQVFGRQGKEGPLVWSAFDVLLAALEGILACILEGGKVVSFGEGRSSWKVRRLEFLEPWEKFEGGECMAWRRASSRGILVFLFVASCCCPGDRELPL